MKSYIPVSAEASFSVAPGTPWPPWLYQTLHLTPGTADTAHKNTGHLIQNASKSFHQKSFVDRAVSNFMLCNP